VKNTPKSEPVWFTAVRPPVEEKKIAEDDAPQAETAQADVTLLAAQCADAPGVGALTAAERAGPETP
jgi:hypothetical protein